MILASLDVRRRCWAQAAHHLLGVLVEQGIVLHDEEAVVVLLQNGHELEEGVGPAHVQLGDVPV